MTSGPEPGEGYKLKVHLSLSLGGRAVWTEDSTVVIVTLTTLN